MTHVVLQNCCSDAACVDVCPVNCIHPRPDSIGYATAEMLYIDPHVCIDCGACIDVCPVGAIKPDYDLNVIERVYLDINAAHFSEAGARDYEPKRPARSSRSKIEATEAPLRVAIVGAGPAGFYAAQELLDRVGPKLEIDLIERLLVPGGLSRFGVAPDHLETKDIVRLFDRTLSDRRLSAHFGVEIGRDFSHEDLCAAYDAVIYAVGANSDRSMGIVGETLVGSHSAREFAGWYNGHPEFADHQFGLDSERAVIIGNGNVALDLARILTRDKGQLHRSDMAVHAVAALSKSKIGEIAVLGRRSPLDAAFTLPELLALRDDHCAALWTDMPVGFEEDPLYRRAAAAASWTARRKSQVISHLPRSPPSAARSIRLSFFRSPEALIGEGRVEAVRVGVNTLGIDEAGAIKTLPSGRSDVQSAGLVFRSVGYRGSAIPGVPFDDGSGVVPNKRGRVLDGLRGEVAPGVYVTGWIKRGPTGVMGTNKACAQETVSALLDDLASGAVRASKASRGIQAPELPRRGDRDGWRAIDEHERAAGRLIGRPRVKLVRELEMISVAGVERSR